MVVEYPLDNARLHDALEYNANNYPTASSNLFMFNSYYGCYSITTGLLLSNNDVLSAKEGAWLR